MKYNGKEYSGTREQIVANIKTDLARDKMYVKGTFSLGEETIDVDGELVDVRKKLIDGVQVPYEYNGLLWTEKNLKSNLMNTPKEQLIDKMLVILNAQ